MHIPDFKLERYFAQWEFVAPYMLSSSDVDGYQMNELLALADEECRELWQNLLLGYTESAGHPLLRQQIASLYQQIQPENILTFAGGEEAIFALMNVTLRKDDHAIVTWPGYQSLYTVAQTIGADVSLLQLQEDQGWQLEPSALRKALRPNTRLIVINFPHNPTGAHLDRHTLDEIVAIANEANAYLFSDESYRFLEYQPEQHLPGAADLGNKMISLGVMSKSFALAGLRLGWLATRDVDLLKRVAAFKDYLSICNSAPSEILALIALRAQAQVLARSLAIIQPNLALLDRFFAEWSDIFSWQRPQAGSIAFPHLHTRQSIADFAQNLVQQEGVMLLPGTVYDHPGNNFRIGFGRKNMPEALLKLEHFLKRR
ncbi:aminotransferase class I/II-fold pyridoxal phosphate-dependent enzyme [Dictyobacter kobayashii]|uniref:Aminotransferase n=1 Tax=Dictyobacter kobayashii TaxID=2014872 RepID=A0A402AI27_9CHLR|nr:aminotransferase class I/II-fold pyridoxal phosphate-dependent enzyme [Dictyobacter kobayashii]GCE18756.1 aminotransferase [Dictyobacter kobayashii]